MSGFALPYGVARDPVSRPERSAGRSGRSVSIRSMSNSPCCHRLGQHVAEVRIDDAQVRVLSRSGRNDPGSSGDIRVLIDPEEGSILRILPEGAGNSEGGFLNRAMRVEPGRGGSGGAKAAPDRRTPRYLWHFQFVSIYLSSGQFSSWYFSSSLRNDACTAFRHMPVSVS